MERREFIVNGWRLLVLLAAMQAFSPQAHADDDDDDSRESESDDDDSDDDRDDRSDDDDDDDDEGGSSGSSGKSGGSSLTQSEASSAVRHGKAIPLRDALALFAKRYDGRVIDVQLQDRNRRLVYRIKFRDDNGRVRRVSMDARSGRFLNFLGF